MAAASIRLLSKMIMGHTWDVPRYHETKESLNKGKQINSYGPKHIFASCGHAQWSHDTKLIGHPQKRVLSHHTKFGVDVWRICWDMTQLPVWCLCSEFDWLYRTNGFENEKPLDNFCEGWSDDDVSQIWGRLDKNWRRSSKKTCFSVIQNGGHINSAVIKKYHVSHMGCPKISWNKRII